MIAKIASEQKTIRPACAAGVSAVRGSAKLLAFIPFVT
jgi:hypothetical protein